MPSNLSRREFIGGLAIAAGATMAGCATGHGSAPATAPADAVSAALSHPDGTLTVTGAGKLKPGESQSFTFPNGGPGIIFVSLQGVHGAVSSKCTHMGCTVKFEPGRGGDVLHCPCHDSMFSLQGKVQAGPAKKPLPIYAVSVTGADALLTPV